MDFCEYSGKVQHWAGRVLDNRGKNAELTLKYSRDLVAYGEAQQDHKLIGFGCYYMGETYYGLNDGTHFFEEMGNALSHLLLAKEWELVARCYNYLGIAAMNRGNAPVALDYYFNGLSCCDTYHLDETSVLFQVNIAVLNIGCGSYERAQEYLEKALDYVHTIPESEMYHSCIFCIHVNLVRCLIMQNELTRIDALLDVIHAEHWQYGSMIDHLSLYCIETLYYHRTQQYDRRDACIRMVDELVPQNLTILDIFDDFYEYCTVLLDAGQNKSFWRLVGVLEPLAQNFNILNLHLKIMSLKMKYYRMHGQKAEYLQTAGLYYEVSENMENETWEMMKMVISLRRNLERAKQEWEKAEQENRILQRKSELDQLTQMANRFRLDDYSQQVFLHACEHQLPLVVEILDIDFFKEYNDNYGHQAGDRCLEQVANVLKAVVGESGGFCARYGGDEFVLIFEDITRERAETYADKIKRGVAELGIEHKFSRALPVVTVSQGVCWGMPEEGSRMWDYLHTADDLLYRIKRVSRNNYCVGNISGSGHVAVGAD